MYIYIYIYIYEIYISLLFTKSFTSEVLLGLLHVLTYLFFVLFYLLKVQHCADIFVVLGVFVILPEVMTGVFVDLTCKSLLLCSLPCTRLE